MEFKIWSAVCIRVYLNWRLRYIVYDLLVPDDNAIEVVVQEPKVQTVDPGSTVRFVCTGISQVRGDVCRTIMLL